MKPPPNPGTPVQQGDWLLVQALRRGDSSALEQLLRRHYDLTYRLAINIHDGLPEKALPAVRHFFWLIWEHPDIIPQSYDAPGVSFRSYILNTFAQTHLLKTIRHENISQYY